MIETKGTVVKFTKVHPGAVEPTYATEGAGCFDIYTPDSIYVDTERSRFYKVNTGLRLEIPHNFVMLMFPRSGLAYKYQIRLTNCTGVIDSDYRGELGVLLAFDRKLSAPFSIPKREKIAQGLLVPKIHVFFEEAESLSSTIRGEGGFGSTNEKLGK